MKKKLTTRLTAAAAVAVISLGVAAPAASAYEYGGPTRTFWCSVWPSFCR